MKKGLRFSEGLCIYDGGDEGDRTPDLLTASQALSQLSYAPVRRSTIRELPRRCKDNFGKNSRLRGRGCGTGSRARGPRCPIRPAGARPAGGGVAAALPPGALGTSRVPPTAGFSLSRRGPPSAQRPSCRHQAHYRDQSRPRPPGDLKTMPVYGARPGTLGQAVIGKIKTAGRRLIKNRKLPVWVGVSESAP